MNDPTVHSTLSLGARLCIRMCKDSPGYDMDSPGYDLVGKLN